MAYFAVGLWCCSLVWHCSISHAGKQHTVSPYNVAKGPIPTYGQSRSIAANMQVVVFAVIQVTVFASQAPMPFVVYRQGCRMACCQWKVCRLTEFLWLCKHMTRKCWPLAVQHTTLCWWLPGSAAACAVFATAVSTAWSYAEGRLGLCLFFLSLLCGALAAHLGASCVLQLGLVQS